jgi:tRNA pseudouridine38-40 synthase
MFKYAMVITYDGSSYGGWQVQPNTVSIQSLIEHALTTLCRHSVSVIGSSRTDAKVHALGQVAHFCLENEIDPKKLQYNLNGILPKDIRILDLYPISQEFHARYSAKGKIYHYHLHLDPVLDPFTLAYSWHVPYKLNLSLLKEALPFFIGVKDFSAFANESHKGAAAKNGEREIFRIDLIEEKGGIRLEFEGSGFLYKMVRNITGTLIDISRGKIPLETIPKIFASKDRKQAGATAPPHALFLVKIHYDEKKSPKEA